MGLLDGEVAIVTGAAQGIGAEIALACVRNGAKVVASDLREPSETLAAIKKEGGTAIGVVADVTDDSSLATLVKSSEEAFGPVSVLVNNAGVFGTLELKPFTEITNEEWDFVMRVNSRGVFQASKAVLPSMRKAGRGAIVNIGSGTIHRGAPLFMHYVASKGAVFALSRSLARELADHNIRVNCVLAGFTASGSVIEHPEMIDRFGEYTINARMIKREMKPDDLTGTIVFLASQESKFLTGQAINVDGGAISY